MAISVQNCRKILGDAGKNLKDQEVETIRDTFIAFSDFVIDMEIEKLKLKNYEHQHENANSNH